MCSWCCFCYVSDAELLQGCLLVRSVYVTFTWLGNFVSPFFFAFHLLDLIHRFETLKAVIRSVTRNGRQVCRVASSACLDNTHACVCRLQLFMTFVLMTVIIYVYAIVCFLFFRQTFTVSVCAHCMAVLLSYACACECDRTRRAKSWCVRPCTRVHSSS